MWLDDVFCDPIFAELDQADQAYHGSAQMEFEVLVGSKSSEAQLNDLPLK